MKLAPSTAAMGFSLFTGVAVSAAILNAVEPAFATAPLNLAPQFALLTLITTGILARFVLPHFTHHMQALPAGKRWAALSLAGTFGVLIPIASPFTTAHPQENRDLKVRATGRKEPRAAGNRVAIYGVKVDGTRTNLAGLILANDGKWLFEGETLAAKTLPAELTLRFSIRDHVQIDFASGPDAGIIEMEWEGKRLVSSVHSPYTVKEVHLDNHEPFSLLSVTVYLGYFLLVAGILLGIILNTRPRAVSIPLPFPARFTGAVFIFFLAAWGLAWLAYYPGIMSWDSIYQWGQAKSLEITDTMPATHTLFLWAVTKIWNSPAAVTGLQVLGLTGVMAWGMGILVARGLSRAAAWGLVLACAAIPFNTLITIAVWKDVPFGIALLAVMLMLVRTVDSEGTWLARGWHQAALAFALASMALFRHNGIIPALAVTAGLFVSYRRLPGLKRATALWVLLFIGVRGPLYALLGVQPTSPAFLALPIQNVAALAHEGTPPGESSRALIESILPYELWGASYYPFNYAPVYANANRDILSNQRYAFLWVFIKSVWSHPATCLKATFAVNSVLWRIRPAEGSYTYLLPDAFEPNAFGLGPESRAPWAQAMLQKWLETSRQPPWLSVLWRPALAFYFFLFLGLLLAYRDGPRWLLTVVPLGFNWAGLLLTNPSQEVRYMYPLFLAAPLVLGLLLAISKKQAESGDERAGR